MQVTIAETGITSPGQSRRIKGEGMPVHNFPSDRGDLVVRYKLKMPGSLTDEQRKLLEQVRTRPDCVAHGRGFQVLLTVSGGGLVCAGVVTFRTAWGGY